MSIETTQRSSGAAVADPGDERLLHRSLNQLNRMRTTPRVESTEWQNTLEVEVSLRKLEHAFVERERAAVREWASRAPRDPDGFVRWFEELAVDGPGQGDALFPWLATRASFEEMCWFLRQEMAGEAGFDDLVALTQLKLPARAKLELARNYWDEMGQGTASGMHGPMLEGLSRALEIEVSEDDTVWESLALANLMVALASNRHYAYQSVGALGAIELTAPGRSAQVNAGLKRLGVTGEARRYYALHATLDVKHSRAWNSEVLWPLVAANPAVATPIAEGALMRLCAGERCFERYRSELWSGGRLSATGHVSLERDRGLEGRKPPSAGLDRRALAGEPPGARSTSRIARGRSAVEDAELL